MKRIAMAAAAMIALLGFTGCDVLGTKDSGTSKTPASTVSDWKIKGSFDGWTEHNLTIDEIDTNKITYQITGLYQHATLPIVYEFVLVNPAGKEFKATGADKSVTTVTPGTAFTLGDSSVTDSTTKANAGFSAAKDSYTVSVNITTPAAPSVNLVGGATDAPIVTNAVLLGKLKIKGNQFSQINGAAVNAWTATAGTVSGSTATWDVLVDVYDGEFGFDSLDSFLSKSDIDASSLTATTSTAPTAVELKNTGSGGNVHLTGTTKASSVYTISVTVDATKAVNSGRYMVSATLKTLSTTAWVFTAPSTIYLVGDMPDMAGMTNWSKEDTGRKAVNVTNKVATFSYTATTDHWPKFKFATAKDALWGASVRGFDNIVADNTGNTTISSDYGNIQFQATTGKTYTVTVDFNNSTFTSTNKATVKVVSN